MRKIVLTALLVFLLHSPALAAVGWLPETLKSNPWTFRLNVIGVFVSPVEYINFGRDTTVRLEPKESGIVTWRYVISSTYVLLFIRISPHWLYGKKHTTIWLSSGGQDLGLQMDIL